MFFCYEFKLMKLSYDSVKPNVEMKWPAYVLNLSLLTFRTVVHLEPNHLYY